MYPEADKGFDRAVLVEDVTLEPGKVLAVDVDLDRGPARRIVHGVDLVVGRDECGDGTWLVSEDFLDLEGDPAPRSRLPDDA